VRERAELVDKKHPKVSVRMQCRLLGVMRSGLSYQAVERAKSDR
jgi:hypothetical protein